MEIKPYLRDQIDWEQPFPPEEYAARRAKVRVAMAEAGLDGLYVVRRADLKYLVDYDQIWDPLRGATGLFLRGDNDDTLFFDNSVHTTLVSLLLEIKDAVIFGASELGSSSDLDTIADTLAGRGLATGTIGLQFWGYGMQFSVVEALSEKLKAKGAETADVSLMIEEIRIVKSPREMVVMRQGFEIMDNALEVTRKAMHPGMMETQIEGVLIGSLMEQGCNYPALNTMLGSGVRSGAHHSPPTHRKVKQGDLVHFDVCASLHRYHANICRTLSVGKADERWLALMEKSAGCVDRILAEVKLGDPLTRVDEIGNAYVDEVGLRDKAWWIGGYSFGISMVPDWTGAHWLHRTEETFGPTCAKRVVEPGIIFNFENQFDVWEDWPGGTGCAWIECFMVTENGLELMSQLPRTIRSTDD
jgi:Xaa-Pro aminopeptidase